MCDTLVAVGADGIRFAKNSDRDPNEAQRLVWAPALDHAAGARVRCTWSSVPQVDHTYAVVLSSPWWMWGAEMGGNEHGVVIGNEAVFTHGARRGRARDRDPGQDGPLLGMDLLRLALERASTAREAVEVIVTLLERHGQGGSCSHDHPRFTYDNSYLVADRSTALVLETAGRHHAVEEVRGPGRSISNGLTIPGFAERFADPVRGRVAQCAVRRERTQHAACAARSTADLVAAVRDHDGPAPRYALANGALSAPCAHAGGLLTSTQTTASWVADLTGAEPRHYTTGTAAPCTATFLPTPLEPPPGAEGEETSPLTNRFDPGHRWWRHERLHRVMLRDPAAHLARFAPQRDRLEDELLSGDLGWSEAVQRVEEAEEGWLAEALSSGLPDRRPRWLRELWRRWDRAARMPEEAAP